MSTPDDNLTQMARLLRERIYHEDILLAQRTYNFLTLSVFVAAITMPMFSASAFKSIFSLSLVAYLFSLAQLILGHRTAIAIHFWRMYLREIENRHHELAMDSKLFIFYKEGKVDTLVGTISATAGTAMFQHALWKVVPGTNVLVGAIMPGGVAVLWLLPFSYSIFRMGGNFACAVTVFLACTFSAALLMRYTSGAEPKEILPTQSGSSAKNISI